MCKHCMLCLNIQQNTTYSVICDVVYTKIECICVKIKFKNDNTNLSKWLLTSITLTALKSIFAIVFNLFLLNFCDQIFLIYLMKNTQMNCTRMKFVKATAPYKTT